MIRLSANFGKIALRCAAVLFFNISTALYAGSIDAEKVHKVDSAQLNKSFSTPTNLARWHRGATLVLTSENSFRRITMPEIADFEQSVLLSSNSALSYKLPPGEHDFIIDLGAPKSLSRFFVNNHSAGGTFKLKTSNTLEPIGEDHWAPVTGSISFNKGVIPSVSFDETKARYILVQFTIEEEGAIGNLGATGSLSRTQAGTFESIFPTENTDG
ncbi:MAG: hypothetical protein ACSHYA_15385 [Opitutaceae bacterium]